MSRYCKRPSCAVQSKSNMSSTTTAAAAMHCCLSMTPAHQKLRNGMSAAKRMRIKLTKKKRYSRQRNNTQPCDWPPTQHNTMLSRRLPLHSQTASAHLAHQTPIRWPTATTPLPLPFRPAMPRYGRAVRRAWLAAQAIRRWPAARAAGAKPSTPRGLGHLAEHGLGARLHLLQVLGLDLQGGWGSSMCM